MKRQNKMKFFILLLLPFLTFLIALSLGRYGVSIDKLFIIFAAKFFSIEHTLPETLFTVIFNVRLPRIIAAMLVGASLSAAGAAYQGLFKNPLVSPDILGATAGAGFGAALAILFSWSLTMIQVSSFIFGLFAVFLTYFISSKMKNNQILVLVLTGVLIGTLFSSFISLIKYIADPFDKLPAITFWLMGSLATVRTADIYIVIIPVLIGILPLYLLRWRLNVLSFGDEEAKAMGINTDAIRVVIIICSTLVTASAVCISGVIGWVGLVIPHLARAVVGPDYNKLLPASILLGSSYLLLVDTIARVVTYIEIPLGILTSLIGAPFFIYLLNKSRWG